MSRFTCTLLTAIFILAATSHAKVTASVIVQDTFTVSNSTPPNGLTPSPVDVPGQNWTAAGSAISGNTLAVGGDGGTSIDIASAGSYTKPGNFQISADLNLATTAGLNGGSYGDGHSVYGLRLGFLGGDATAGTNRLQGPGIVYTSNTTNGALGELLLVNGSTIVQDLGLTGFSSTGNYNLSYLVNTASGSISGVTFNGNAIAVGATALFTDAATDWAGFYQRPDGVHGNAAFADNFTITSVVPVPEPVSLVLLGLGAVGLIPAALRRRRV